MLYPFKFDPVFKDYIWGGNNLKKLGKNTPDGITAESWEVSCHADGASTIANGVFKGIKLSDLVKVLGKLIVGNISDESQFAEFPLLFKLIDANQKLSVQVHPNDMYAEKYENGQFGKNEMWYILDAKPGAKLVYGTAPDITRKQFEEAIENDNIESTLNYIDVAPGDIINIPAGLVHAIGEGIVLAEIQQNSNLTYRVYDYNRVDANGNRRPLHLNKALDVIDFDSNIKQEKAKGIAISSGTDSTKRVAIANPYFLIEEYNLNGIIHESTSGNKFHIYYCIDGNGSLLYGNEEILDISIGDSILVPAALGDYKIYGNLKLLKASVPDLVHDVIEPLLAAGYSESELFENIAGLKTQAGLVMA